MDLHLDPQAEVQVEVQVGVQLIKQVEQALVDQLEITVPKRMGYY